MKNRNNGGLKFRSLKYGTLIYSPPYRILVYKRDVKDDDDRLYSVAVYKSGSNSPVMFIRRSDDISGTFEAFSFIYKNRYGNRRKSNQ